MDNKADERSPLIERTSSADNNDGALSSVKGSSTTTLGSAADSMKSSEVAVGMWERRRVSPPAAGRRRAQSWSAGPPDDVSSDIRILRERLVRTQTRPRPSAMRRLTRRQRLTLASLALVDFMSFCSISVMAPFFPGEAKAKGLSDTVCGFVFSFYAIVMFITSPFMGKCLPIVGAKFMFTAGMFVAGFCNVLFGSLVLVEDSAMFTGLCFAVRGAAALGASAYSTASYVFVVNVFPDSIGSVLGILETFVGIGMSVGPAIGSLLYSIGGFGLPFYSIGIIMVLIVPVNCLLLTDCEEIVTGSKSASVMGLFKIPSIMVTGLVIVVASNTWAFLDPTLEPHMRQLGLTTNQIGLVFLLFSSLYGIFSPIWGWVADRVHNHWCMMIWGLFLITVGLLLLGPCPYIPGLPTSVLWLDLVALAILSVSVALTLLPTFQGVLTSSIYEGGCPEALATYSAVAGVWSCCYSLGEVSGPALGGALTERYGFPLSATICAVACFTVAVIALAFFALRESSKWAMGASCSESLPRSDSTWSSGHFCTRSAPDSRLDTTPLLTPCSRSERGCSYYPYDTSTPKRLCIKHRNPNKSGSASVAETIVHILKFEFVTNTLFEIRKRNQSNSSSSNAGLYQNYLGRADEEHLNNNNKYHNLDSNQIKSKDRVSVDYCSYLENAIFGSSAILENVHLDNLLVKRNNKGLVSTMTNNCSDRKSTEDILRYNLEKVNFYENIEPCPPMDNISKTCECKDGVTFFTGTVALSSTGACEV
ncbi:MFS-type transporter SLC18B1-like [Cydia fagiglandana]|uniref:MFS-type transporter SLC18B1-like n=1 Tax=Cydia fagiglandana TaxID=1458189 RepID=UPI002FEE0AB0